MHPGTDGPDPKGGSVVFIRTSTFQADPSKLDKGIEFARANVPGALSKLDGSLGWTMLVNREDGRCMVNSWWESEKALKASDKPLAPLRKQGGEVLGAPAKPEEWEVVVMERRREITSGCGARMTRVRLDPTSVDHGIDVFRTTTVPDVTIMDGFCAVSMAVNRRTGEALATVIFENMAAVEATREKGKQVRATTAEKSHAEILDVHEYEFVEARISPPEHL